MTPGMPYGMKKVARKNPGQRADADSSSSASTVAATIITGTCTTPKSSMRPMDAMKFPSSSAIR